MKPAPNRRAAAGRLRQVLFLLAITGGVLLALRLIQSRVHSSRKPRQHAVKVSPTSAEAGRAVQQREEAGDEKPVSSTSAGLSPDDYWAEVIAQLEQKERERAREIEDPPEMFPHAAKPISPKIYEWADTWATDDLIEFILANPGESDGTKPSEDAAVAVWALALQLKRDPSILDRIYNALLRPDIAEGAVMSLTGILARCPEEKAIDRLLELARLDRPKWFTLWVLKALACGGSRNEEDIETYIRTTLDPYMDDEHGKGRIYLDTLMAPAGSPIQYLLRADVGDTIARYCAQELPNAAPGRERGAILTLLRALLQNEYDVRALSFRENPENSAGYIPPQWAQLAVQTAIRFLQSGQVPVESHSTILGVIALHRTVETKKLMLEMLETSPDWRARAFVAQHHVDYYPPELRAQAEMALWRAYRSDPVEAVRRNAVFSLPRTTEVKAEIVNFLMNEYRHGGYGTRIRVIYDLALLGLDGIPHLEHIASTDDDAQVRAEAAAEIARIKLLTRHNQSQRTQDGGQK